MKDRLLFFIAGLIGGSVISLMFNITLITDGSTALHNCEKSLPRDQQCELYAKPQEVKK